MIQDADRRAEAYGALFAVWPPAGDLTAAVRLYVRATADLPLPELEGAIGELALVWHYRNPPYPADVRRTARERRARRAQHARELHEARARYELEARAASPQQLRAWAQDLEAKARSCSAGAGARLVWAILAGAIRAGATAADRRQLALTTGPHNVPQAAQVPARRTQAQRTPEAPAHPEKRT